MVAKGHYINQPLDYQKAINLINREINDPFTSLQNSFQLLILVIKIYRQVLAYIYIVI